MKLCPFCAEEIQDAALKCSHCGRKVAASRAEWRAALIFGAVLIGVIAMIGLNLDSFLDMFTTSNGSVATSKPAVHPDATELLRTVPAGTFTPAQIEMARRDIEFTKSITKWEESSTGAYITFQSGNYNPDKIQLYRRAEMIVIGDQASTGKIRYLTFYDPTNKKVATFSPAFGLKLVE